MGSWYVVLYWSRPGPALGLFLAFSEVCLSFYQSGQPSSSVSRPASHSIYRIGIQLSGQVNPGSVMMDLQSRWRGDEGVEMTVEYGVWSQ
jgi:hypothetical protein